MKLPSVAFFARRAAKPGEVEVSANVKGKVVSFRAGYAVAGGVGSLEEGWRGLVGGDDWLHIQQVGQRGTLLGVACADEVLGRAFTREVICGGRSWLELCRRDHLFLVGRGGVTVRVGRRMRISSYWGQVATRWILPEACAEVEREEVERGHRMEALEVLRRYSGGEFFRGAGLCFAGSGDVLAVREAGGRCLLVYGDMGGEEARALVGELALIEEWVRGDSGHWIVESRRGKVGVRVERCGCGGIVARVEAFVRGFLRLVVVSDLHIGVEGRDTFGSRKRAGLLRLLERIERERSTLVLNGDFLELHHEYYGAIRRSYEEVFLALARVRRVVYVAGNHDEDILREKTKEIRRSARRRARREVRARVGLNSLGTPFLSVVRRGLFSASRRRAWVKLFSDPRVLEWLREAVEGGGQVYLSAGFDREGVAYGRGVGLDGPVWYLDCSLVQRRGAADELLKLLADRRQRLDRVIRADLGRRVRIVRYYWEAGRGLYFEHGHAAVPSCNGLNVGRYVAGLTGLLRSWGVADLEDLVEERIGAFVRRVYPFARVREINQFIERVLPLGYWLRSGEGDPGAGCGVRIVMGHTHEEAAVEAGAVHRLARALVGVSYANTGAWSSRLRRAVAGETGVEWLEVEADGRCRVEGRDMADGEAGRVRVGRGYAAISGVVTGVISAET